MKYFLPSGMGLILLSLATWMENENHQEWLACTNPDIGQCLQEVNPSGMMFGVGLLVLSVVAQSLISVNYIKKHQTQARLYKIWLVVYPVVIGAGLYAIYG